MTSVADQKTLTELTKKFDGRTPVRVHFLDNSSKVFLIHEYANFKDLITMCLEKLSIVDKSHVLPYFAIYESRDGTSLDGAFPLDALVLDTIRNWSESRVDKAAKFVFMIRLFMPCIWGLEHKDVIAYQKQLNKEDLTNSEYLECAPVIDPSALHLQFIQAVYNVITGRYPTTPEESIDLGALHFLFKFGNYRSDRHVVGFLGNRIVEFIPLKHLKSALASMPSKKSKDKDSSGGNSLASWESKLLEKVQNFSRRLVHQKDVSAGNGGSEEQEGDGSTQEEYAGHEIFFKRDGMLISPQRMYMELIYCMVPIYGSTLFKCSQKSTRALPDVVNIAAYSEGIHIFDKSKKLVRSFFIEDILRWGFKPQQSFFFEVNPELELGTGSLEFETTEGKVISDLLTDYALAFLKEREKEEERFNDMENGKYNMPPPPKKTATASHAPPPPGEPQRRQYTAREHRAATTIQALYRGFSLRNEWAREDAAILIQSVFRGYRARILLSKIIEQMIKDGLL